MTDTMICADVGNTNITFGLFSDDVLCKTWRFQTSGAVSSTVVYENIIQNTGLECFDICVGSVVPKITTIFTDISIKNTGVNVYVFNVHDDTVKSKIASDNPSEVGADIILNGIAAYEKYNSAMLIIDFGTAITFDYFDKKGHFIGNSIVPGVEISLNALYTMADLLPKIEIKATQTVIGGHTEYCMQSGIFWGYVSLVEGMICRIKEELKVELVVIATGGLAPLFVNKIPAIQHTDNTLTLKGLRVYMKGRLQNDNGYL